MRYLICVLSLLLVSCSSQEPTIYDYEASVLRKAVLFLQSDCKRNSKEVESACFLECVKKDYNKGIEEDTI